MKNGNPEVAIVSEVGARMDEAVLLKDQIVRAGQATDALSRSMAGVATIYTTAELLQAASTRNQRVAEGDVEQSVALEVDVQTDRRKVGAKRPWKPPSTAPPSTASAATSNKFPRASLDGRSRSPKSSIRSSAPSKDHKDSTTDDPSSRNHTDALQNRWLVWSNLMLLVLAVATGDFRNKSHSLRDSGCVLNAGKTKHITIASLLFTNCPLSPNKQSALV